MNKIDLKLPTSTELIADWLVYVHIFE